MESFIIIGGLVLLLIWLASHRGSVKKAKEQLEDILNDVQRSKDVRNSMRNKSVRSKLRDFFDKNNK